MVLAILSKTSSLLLQVLRSISQTYGFSNLIFSSFSARFSSSSIQRLKPALYASLIFSLATSAPLRKASWI
nr:MAG TPA: hypothetical protein [Caudoviricetes sp.]